MDDKVNEYKNTYLGTIKMKPVGVTSDTYINFVVENDQKYPKFKVADHFRISKYRNIFTKGYTSKLMEMYNRRL